MRTFGLGTTLLLNYLPRSSCRSKSKRLRKLNYERGTIKFDHECLKNTCLELISPLNAGLL